MPYDFRETLNDFETAGRSTADRSLLPPRLPDSVAPPTMNIPQSTPLVAEVGDRNFQEEVLRSSHPVLVEFWTPWSRPCQILDSVLGEIGAALAGKGKVVRVNADDSLDLSLLYDIQSVPTLLCFVGGKPLVRIVGTASKEAILAKLKPLGVV